MLYVGIDLAERHSAAVIIDHEGAVHFESCLDAGPQEKPPNPWKNIDAIRDWRTQILSVVHYHMDDAKYVIEIPHFHARNGEPALLVQGGMLCAMREVGIPASEVSRIPAMEWMSYFGFSKAEHGNTKTWAAMYAKTYFDYEPGMTWAAGTRMVKKMREDLTDARLLAEWLKQNDEA